MGRKIQQLGHYSPQEVGFSVKLEVCLDSGVTLVPQIR